MNKKEKKKKGKKDVLLTVSASLLLQAVEAAQLAEDLKVQLEHTQAKLKEIQVSVAENRTARERESSNLKRALVRRITRDLAPKSQWEKPFNCCTLPCRKTCPGCGGSWRNRRRWRCIQTLMRFCRRRSISTRLAGSCIL